MIYVTEHDIVTSSGKYPDRAKLVTPEISQNISNLYFSLNCFFNELFEGDAVSIQISSGLRGQAVNAKVGGAVKSAHLRGMAVDIVADENLKRDIYLAVKLRIKYGLMMERPKFTPTWCHLDMVKRSFRNDWSFNP